MLQDLHQTQLEPIPREIQSREIKAPAQPRMKIGIAESLVNARTLFRHGEVHLALNLLRGLCGQNPRNERLLALLAEKLEAHQFVEEALRVRASLMKISSSYVNAMNYAHALYRANRDQEALNAYYETLSMQVDEDMTAFEIYKNMGNIFLKGGDVESAEEFFNKAYVLSPESDVLLVNMGTLEIQKGHLGKAIQCFRQAVEISPANDKAWTGLAMLHGQQADAELAWGNLETALDHNPKNRTALILAANWAVRDAQPARATTYIENYLADASFDEELALVLVNLYCMSGRYQHAQLECARILAWNPEQAEVNKLLPQIEAKAGEMVAA